MQKNFLDLKKIWITYCWMVIKVGIFLYALNFFIYTDLYENSGPLHAMGTNVDTFLLVVNDYDSYHNQEKTLSIEKPPSLLEPIVLQAAGLISTPPEAIRSRHASVNLNLLGGSGKGIRASAKQDRPDEIMLNLFEDVELIAVLERIEFQNNNSYSWIGRLKDDPFSQAIFVVKDDFVVGNIRNISGIYQIRSIQEQIHVIYEIDEARFPESINDTISVSPSQQAEGETGLQAVNHPNHTEVAADEEPVVDVMVAYTADARAAAGGASAMEALIHLAVAETNQSYANSGIDFTIRLVHQYEVDYRETGNAEKDLKSLTSTSDGIIDDVHVMRDLYAADIISFWVADSDSCGLTWAMETPNDMSFQSKAFSTIQQDCAIGNYSFGHEIGHLLGAQHDWFVDHKTTVSIPRAVHDYSHGYVNPTNRWRTIMAYNNRCHPAQCIRLPYWSNPSVHYNDVPTGIDSGKIDCKAGVVPTVECDADTQRTLDNQWATVAQFRNRETIATIHKSVSSDFIDAGQALTYTITILNVTSAIDSGVVITGMVPANATLLPGSVSSGGTVTGTIPGSVITWNMGDVRPGTETTLTFVVIPDNDLTKGTEITSTAYLVSANRPDPLPSNMVVSKLDGADCGFYDSFESEVLGEYWTGSTTNGGTLGAINNPGDANSGSRSIWINRGITRAASADLILRTALQGRPHVTLDFAWKSFRNDGFFAHADDGVFLSKNNGITWAKVYSFTVDQTSYISATVKLDESHSVDSSAATERAESSPLLNNDFRVKFQTNSVGTPNGFAVDDVSLNCTPYTLIKEHAPEMAQETVPIRVPVADLTITKSVTPSTVWPSDRITYTLAYSNIGPDTATNIIISDAIPITLTDVAYIGNPPIVLIEDTRYRWQVPDLAANGKGMITVTGVVSPGLTHNSRIASRVMITATNDSSASNNSGQALVQVEIPQPELTLKKIVIPEVAQPGAVVTYILTIVNNGPGVATDVVVSNPLPAGLRSTESIMLGDTDSDTIGIYPSIDSGQQITLTYLVVVGNIFADTMVRNTTLVTSSEILNPIQSTAVFTVGSLPTVTLNIDNSSLSEKSDQATITAMLSTLSPQDVVVAFDLSGTATYGADYTMTTQITIPAGHLSGSSKLYTTDDILVETDETIVVEIADVVNVKEFRVQQIAVTIVDDEKLIIPPTATLAPTATSVETSIATATPTAVPVMISEITFTPTIIVTSIVTSIVTPIVTPIVTSTETLQSPVEESVIEGSVAEESVAELIWQKFIYFFPFISQ